MKDPATVLSPETVSLRPRSGRRSEYPHPTDDEPSMPVSLATFMRRLRIVCTIAALAGACLGSEYRGTVLASERMTPVVRATQSARPSVVNIHGEKVVGGDSTGGMPGDRRRVNGMGTGIVIDERGYIITNHHVVDGVRKILVTTHDLQTHLATLVSHDPKTDLAIIKIEAPQPLTVITIGTSADLMPGETVIAMGNAFGYEHTVTTGIVSALHRSVQVSDTQSYEDLIQTDAAINPGNSGGPLLNIDGEMIGINVAVRAGAQNIGFAIPIDKALTVATDLLSTRRIDRTWHGMVVDASTSPTIDGALVREVIDQSPAAAMGLRPGDVIKSIASKPIRRVLDIERALLGKQAGAPVPITIERDRKTETFDLTMTAVPQRIRAETAAVTATATTGDRFWDALGLRLEPVPQRTFQNYRTRYRGGLAVTDVRSDSPAARQGIRRGDVLVGMHIWETITADNVNYVLDRPDFSQLEPLKFYILRGNETLFGHFSVARAP
jgi:serine protease Do